MKHIRVVTVIQLKTEPVVKVELKSELLIAHVCTATNGSTGAYDFCGNIKDCNN